MDKQEVLNLIVDKLGEIQLQLHMSEPIGTDDRTRAYRVSRGDRHKVKLTDPNDPRHGTYGGYCNHGCRCEACRKAQREYGKVKRKKKQL